MRVVVVFRALIISLVGAVGANAFGGFQEIAASHAADASFSHVTFTPDPHDLLPAGAAIAPAGQITLESHLLVLPPLGMEAVSTSAQRRTSPGSGIVPGFSADVHLPAMPQNLPHEAIAAGPPAMPALHADESRSVAAPLPAATGPALAVLGAALVRGALRRHRRRRSWAATFDRTGRLARP